MCLNGVKKRYICESPELKLSVFLVVQQETHTCTECGLKFICPELFNTHLHQHAVEEEDEKVEKVEDQAEGDTRLDLRMSHEDVDNDEENDDIETSGDDGDCWETSTRKRIASLQAAGAAGTAYINGKLRNAYSCLACGKVYTYLVPFLKHQLLHKLHSGPRRSPKGGRLHRYKCSTCGMMFVRKVQLRAHMRIHGLNTFARADLHQCDQCGKTFASTRTWAAHMELHKQHLFWCLSCSKGFPDEIALDKHLQGHNNKQHTCKICHESFSKMTELMAHYKAHTAAKAYQCTLCAKSFKFLGNLISHRKQHLRAFPGGDGRATKHSSKVRFRKGNRQFSLSRTEKPGIYEPEAPGAESAESEDSDCGEPTHQLKPLNQSDKPGLETVPPKAGQEVQETEAGGEHIHREHKYWEWDCCLCDMGFDEVEKLHMHYVKHATGELPISQEYT